MQSKARDIRWETTGWRGVYQEVGEETESGSFPKERWSAKGEEEEIIWDVSLYFKSAIMKGE